MTLFSCVWRGADALNRASGQAEFELALTPWCLQVLVWKEIRYGRMSEKEKSMLVSEVNILRELKHPNIVRYKVCICSSDPRPRVQHASGRCLLLTLGRLRQAGSHNRQRDVNHLHHHGVLRERRSLCRHSQVCHTFMLCLPIMVASTHAIPRAWNTAEIDQGLPLTHVPMHKRDGER